MARKITHEQIMEMVDSATLPEVMDWRKAKEFLEELAAEINGRAEVLEEENADDGG